MMKNINYTKLLIKMHYFFFLASSGATFPYLQVYGKQLGISPIIIGTITAILPALCVIAKPVSGFIMDCCQVCRKVIFLSFLVIGTTCHLMLFFLSPLSRAPLKYHYQNISYVALPHNDTEYHAIRSCNGTEDIMCHWECKNTNSSKQLSFRADQKEAIISPDTICLLHINETSLYQENITNYNCDVICNNFNDDQYLYTSITFWSYVLLLCVGDIGIHVFISLSDAVCFGILGKDNRLKYGKQRLWGTFGFGFAAFLTGFTINLWSQKNTYETYTPLIFLVTIFTCIDLLCCIKLKLPFERKSPTILKDVSSLLKSKTIVIFLCFIIFSGILNSILRNFLFWYLEDLAIKTHYMDNIKLIEGLIVAVQTFGGEIIFFFLSGKILKKFGYGYTIAFCFICYGLRLGLISLAPTPWWILPIEFLQGPSYALCLTTIVGYADTIAPHGASATVQGLVLSLYDSLGVSIGSLMGGALYKKFGGIMTLRIFSVFAVFAALMYLILHTFYIKRKMDKRNNIQWKEPDGAQEYCVVTGV